MTRPQDVKDLQLVEDGKVAVRPAFGVSLFTAKSFYEIPDAVLACQDLFLKLCPQGQVKYYLTETMDQHAKVTERTFTMLPTWLRKGAPKREQIFLELKSGDDREEAPEFRLEVSSNEDGSIGFESEFANSVHFTLPVAWGTEHADKMRDFLIHLAGFFPYSFGYTGFALEWSPYFEEEACTHAYAKGMRHPGFDIYDNANFEEIVGHDSLAGVGWLTLLGPELIGQLGGRHKIRSALAETTHIRDAGHGLMVSLGDAPEIGDTNRRDLLPAYRELYALLSPVAEVGIERSSAFEFHPGDVYENTLRWLRRFKTA